MTILTCTWLVNCAFFSLDRSGKTPRCVECLPVLWPRLTFSPRISFRCCWSLRFTSRMRFPWSRMALIFSDSALLSRRTKSSLLHFSKSSSDTLERSSDWLSAFFAIAAWCWGCVGFSMSTNLLSHLKSAAAGRKKTAQTFCLHYTLFSMTGENLRWLQHGQSLCATHLAS